MNRRRQLLPAVVALVTAAALVGSAPPRPPAANACPDRGPTGVVDAGALAYPVPVRGCALDGSVVGFGALAVRVPATDGESVTAAGAGRGGHPTVLTITRAAGAVRAQFRRPNTEPLPPPHPPISRLGRADGQPPDPPHTSAAAPPTGEPEATPIQVRCGDDAGAWLGMRWHSPYRWVFRATTVPAYLGADEPVLAAIQAAGQAVDEGRNDCGLVGELALSQHYAGRTERDAGIRADATCGERDERNVVAFGQLDGGLLALTCLWWSRGRTVEADIRISDAPGTFTLDPTVGCTGSWDLHGTLTHEFGHVFGLGHVSYAEHGDLTMSDGLPACSAGFRALGLGDYRTLRAQYGTG